MNHSSNKKYTDNKNRTDKHAIVIGGSMAGMLAARVLSDHFDRVTVIERDALSDEPDARKGQPQARHLHALLAGGLLTMQHYFPDLIQEFRRHGQAQGDMGMKLHWHIGTGYRKNVPTGLWSAIITRPMLEWQLRRRVLALPNVTVCSGGDVYALLTDEFSRRVTGVQAIWRLGEQNECQRELIAADLVIDTSGRGSRTPKWLTELGYEAAPERSVSCDITYATRLFRRNPDDPLGGRYVMITPIEGETLRQSNAFPVEGDRWQVTVAAGHGEPAPANEDAFVEFARTLPTAEIYDIVTQNEPLTDIAYHKFPASLRRYYEKLNRFPGGYLVLGDAVCSFNPIFGQGMTSAAMQAQVLDELLDKLLRERGVDRLDGLAARYFRRIAKVIDTPWNTAVSEDFRYADTQGDKPMGTDLLNRFSAAIHRATLHDPLVSRDFVRVVNMVAPPTIFFRPQILWRVLRSEMRRWQHNRSPRAVPAPRRPMTQPVDAVR